MWTKLRELQKLRYDIILLQETKLTHDDLTDDLQYRWKQVSDGEAFTTPALTAQVGGVAILLSAYACARLTDLHTIDSNADEHRYIALSAKLDGQPVLIHSIYAPVHRQDRPSFFNSLPTPPHGCNNIIGGDFNCVMDASCDTIGDHTLASQGSTELTTWLTSFGATDVWRQQHDDAKEFTSPAGQSRIDMIFLSGCFTANCRIEHLPRMIGSDHLCPSATLASSNITFKGGHWQLPLWLTRQAAQRIKPTLEKLAQSTDSPNYVNTFVKTMKLITAQCKSTHKAALRQRKHKIDRARLAWMRAHMRATVNPSTALIEDAERTRQRWIKEINDDEQRKRAWAFDKHFSEAERCTRFFLNRVNKKNATTIPGVKRPDGTISTDSSHIQEAHKSFWTKLYSRDANGTETPPSQPNIDILTNTPLPSLSPTAAQMLDADVTEKDIIRQIELLPLRKAAGSDGLRGELLKQTPKLWARVLLPIYQKLLHQHESLPTPFQESIIILLHKKGCTLDPGNYRPIALVNVMAKLLSSIHCSRLRRILHTVIPNEQTGFVPGRAITENIILLNDSIHYAKQHHPSAIVLALDFAKAYDRIQWPIMLAILTKMGFGPRFMAVIGAMYKMRRAHLSINGELSQPFDIERGVLQGDPLSPALFILACAPLYAKMDAARNTHGIPLPADRPAPVATYYADDTTIIARSPSSAIHLYNIAEWFCTHSGALLHRGKCIAIPTGPASLTLDNGIKILQPSECTTILGVPMGRCVTRSQQVEGVIKKMLDRCTSWHHVGRTIEGRITVARAIILSTVWYTLAALPIIPSEAKKIEAVVNNFINRKEQSEWGAATARGNMTHEWFYRAGKQGGWGLSPVLRSLKCRKLSILRRFIADKNQEVTKPWHTFALHMMNKLTNEWGEDWNTILYWHGPQRQGDAGVGDWHMLSPWWRDAWDVWLKLQCRPARNSIHINTLKRWPVWNNRILARDHGIDSPLRTAFSNSTTRAHMATIRKEGFTSFRHFIRDDGMMMSGEELYIAVTVSTSVNGTESVVPRSACATLMRTINALWTNTKNKWQLHSSTTPTTNHIKWYTQVGDKTPFNSANNRLIAKSIKATEPHKPEPKLIKLRGVHAQLCWNREAKLLAQLAPSRRDLLRRLIRNALPVGSKRVHWTVPAQTLCMLCNEGKLETAKHLFWQCSFAKETWGTLTTPWRSHRQTSITWDEVLLGTEVRVGHTHNTQVDQLWSIVRACMIRTIWFERNRRYFYATSPRRSPNFRKNQGRDDMKIHIESWIRRADGEHKDNVINAVKLLMQYSAEYANIVIPTPNNATPT